MKPQAALALAAAAWLATPPVAHAFTVRGGRPVMGTVLEVTVVADDFDLASDLTAGAFDIAQHWDDVLTTWRGAGELSRLNAQAGKGEVSISDDLAAALRRCLELSLATGGAVDPAVGPLVIALRSGRSLPAEQGELPARYRIATALELGDNTARLLEGAALDAGGIGKGIALDAIDDYLASNGASAWFLDFGGSSQLAHGVPEHTSAWIVAVAGNEEGHVHGTLKLQNASVSTSRALPTDDPAGTIIDPRTGKPVPPPRLATVVALDAATAEAWSTALIVLGREGIAKAHAAGLAALVEDADGKHGTPAFAP